MTVVEKIKKALRSRVATLATVPEMPVAWDNKPFVPAGLPYLAVDFISNRNTRITIKGSNPHLRQGILQLTVVGELGVGPGATDALVGAVAEHFPADLVLTYDDVEVRVEKTPDDAPPIRDDKTWRVPVSIRFQAFA